MKKKLLSIMMLALLMTGCSKETDSSTNKVTENVTSKTTSTEVANNIQQEKTAILLAQAKDTYDVKTCFSEDSDLSTATYSIDDTTIATIDNTGTITAIKEGNTTIKVTCNNIDYTIDLCIFNYFGTYGGSKTVAAMNCEIDMQLTLEKENSKFDFYRGPMDIKVGSTEMHEDSVELDGTYNIVENKFYFTFTEDYSGYGYQDFNMSFALDASTGAKLTGAIPTGGAMSDFVLMLGVTIKEAA